jgi:hypothetical protein
MKKRLISIFAAIIMLFTSCFRMRCIDGNHTLENQKRHISTTFSGIELQSAFDIVLRDNGSDTIEVEAESNLQTSIITEIRNGILIIKTPHGRCIDTHEKVTIACKLSNIHDIVLSSSGSINSQLITNNTLKYIIDGSGDIRISKSIAENTECKIDGSGNISIDSVTSRSIKYTISGSGDLKATNTTCESSTLKINGSGNITSKIVTNTLDAEIDGSGKIAVSGMGQNAKISIMSSGNFEGYSFFVKTCNATISGSGDIRIAVSDTLNASINGSGSIKYVGSPIVIKSIRGSGSISKR